MSVSAAAPTASPCLIDPPPCRADPAAAREPAGHLDWKCSSGARNGSWQPAAALNRTLSQSGTLQQEVQHDDAQVARVDATGVLGRAGGAQDIGSFDHLVGLVEPGDGVRVTFRDGRKRTARLVGVTRETLSVITRGQQLDLGEQDVVRPPPGERPQTGKGTRNDREERRWRSVAGAGPLRCSPRLTRTAPGERRRPPGASTATRPKSSPTPCGSRLSLDGSMWPTRATGSRRPTHGRTSSSVGGGSWTIGPRICTGCFWAADSRR